MKLVRAPLHRVGFALMAGIACSLVCLAIQYSSFPLSYFGSQGVSFKKLEVGHWNANVSSLAIGSYFVSAGRPRSLCDLLINGKLASTTKSAQIGFRENLLLGSSFAVTGNNLDLSIDIKCEVDGGFQPGLTHAPVVLHYRPGVLLHLWRAGTELFLGVFCGFLLLLSLVFRKKRTIGKTNLNASWPHYVFGACAVIYSLSLAHFPRMFLNGLPSSVLHTLARTGFSLGFYLLCAHYSRFRLGVVLLHAMLILSFIAVGEFSPTKFEQLYDFILPVFTILTAIAVFDLCATQVRSRSALFLRYVAATWLLAQAIDMTSAYLNFGAYMAPSMVALMTAMVALLKRQEDERSDQTETTSNRVLQLINGPGTIELKLKELGVLISSQTHFVRASVYADAYVLGVHDRPYEKFIRVMESGYRKSTEKDRVVDFSEGRGVLMRAALESGSANLRRGDRDSAWFSNVSLGKHAVLNLSDDSEQPAYLAAESYELIERVLPALKSISERLAEYGARMGYALESLRLVRGDGTWSEQVGSIFLDVNGYDDGIEQFQDPYGRFVGKVFLPALCQRVRRWAVREGNSSGDAVYLVCISDLMQESCSIEEAVYKTLEEVMKFIQGEGAEMCRAQGYDPIQLQIGANVGIATVICDSFQVRTAGRVVNEAARLQKAAEPNSVFVHADFAEKWPSDGALTIDQQREELVKTRRLNGRRVYLKSAGKKRAS